MKRIRRKLRVFIHTYPLKLFSIMLTFRHGATYCDVIKNIMVSFRLLDMRRMWFMQCYDIQWINIILR